MTDASGSSSDRTLLERLNALKPSTVNLDPSSKTIAASTIEPAKLPSREDALSERLKSLRNQSNDKSLATPSSEANRGDGDTVTSSPPPNQTSQPHPGPKNPGAGLGASQLGFTGDTNDDADPLLYTDDQTLEELLADLESDQPWLDEVVAEEEEHRRVTALLDELGKASRTDDNPDKSPEPTKLHNDDGDEDSSDDNSDGEKMTLETDDILAQTVDEVELEKANEPALQPEPNTTQTIQRDETNKSPSQQKPNETDPFSLPAVPSDLQDQPNLPGPSQDEDDADFAASITSRMAALRVNASSSAPGRTLPSAPTTAVDAFGLPAAPTFAPADRPAPGLIKRFGYTDEDQKTWCVVCLEDGTIRCLDCDGDVYCARCWREMHVGLSAGYDERGHRWEKFVRGQ